MKDSSTNLRLIEAHVDILGELPREITAHSTMLAQLGLPYRKVDGKVFERRSGPYSLQLRAGSSLTTNGFLRQEIPFGSKSRLVLLMLTGAAVRLRTRHVPVDKTFTAFCRDTLGLDTNGRNLKILKTQLLNMSCVDMTLAYDKGKTMDVTQGAIFSKLSVALQPEANQTLLWPDEISFSEEFFRSLQTHRYMLDTRAIRSLSHSSRALDVYCWLAYRCWRLKRPTNIRWRSLLFQFSDNPKTAGLASFKRRFKKALQSALLVYPQCRVEIERDYVTLFPSKPPVLPRP